METILKQIRIFSSGEWNDIFYIKAERERQLESIIKEIEKKYYIKNVKSYHVEPANRQLVITYNIEIEVEKKMEDDLYRECFDYFLEQLEERKPVYWIFQDTSSPVRKFL